ncbi:cyclophilin-like fold protein [Campylobacter avium]|uniref:cyclophilin-like fold protein n=1 Tax=Campylobacter avium TaxID=522485 RepID=UPI0023545857|nr:cyclophilin-like fold protein [Campylobacter avium]
MRILLIMAFLDCFIFAKEANMVFLEYKTQGVDVKIQVELDNNQASKEFLGQLPLELEFSDYANKEKIAHLPKALTVKNTPDYDPQIGDLFYFSPWGNIGIFYGKQPPYNGLVYLGKLVNAKDLQSLRSIKGNFKLKITR